MEFYSDFTYVPFGHLLLSITTEHEVPEKVLPTMISGDK